MKKEFVVVGVCLILVLCLSFVSASWLSDLWGKITGQVSEEEEIDAYVSIATLKDVYGIGEKVELTDPPDEVENSDDEEKSFVEAEIEYVNEENMIYKSFSSKEREKTMDYLQQERESIQKIQGYIIEFDDDPTIVKKVELEKKAEKNKGSFKLKIPFVKNFVLTPEKVPKKVKEYSKDLRKSNDKIKSKIINELYDFNGSKITGQAISDERYVEILSEYEKVFNGIVLDISKKEAEKIKSINGVKKVYPNYEVKTTLMDSVPLVNSDAIWKMKDDFGKDITGEGVTIAIIDTGVDYTHPDLGGCFGEGCKVIGGYDFVNDDDDPMDDNGHGTHCAAIAAGKSQENELKTYKYKEGDYVGVGEYVVLSEGDNNDPLLAIKIISIENISDSVFLVTFQKIESGERGSFYMAIQNQFAYYSDEIFYIKLNISSRKISFNWGTNANYDDAGDFVSNSEITSTKSIGLNGVAPDAKIYAYKVLDCDGTGWTSDVINAMEKTIDLNSDGDFSDSVDIISMSLGGKGNSDDYQSRVVDNIVNAGIVVVVAAGNSGPEGGSSCMHGYDSSENSICSPGTARKAITVGASDKNDEIAGFSSRGPVIWEDGEGNIKALVKPDIVAPGVDICAAQYDSWKDNRTCYDEKHIEISGTSMATPHIAGAVALIKQKNPDWTPEEIKIALKNTAIDLGEDINTRGYGRVDVLEAVGSEKPLIAELDAIESMLDKLVNIKGTAKGENFDHYELYYGEENNWNLICEDSEIVEDNVLCSDFNPKNLIDGDYLLRLIVYSNDERYNEDKGFFRIDSVSIHEPLNNDIYRVGDLIELKGSVLKGGFERYFVEVKEINELEWSSKGIVLTKEGNEKIIDDVFAIWDTSQFEKGFYDLRLTVVYSYGNVEEYLYEIHLDHEIKKGWPQKIKWDVCPEDSEGRHIFPGRMSPVVGDLNGDGEKEIVVHFNGDHSKLYVYSLEGELLRGFPKEVDEGRGKIRPLIVDINNDGYNEILIIDRGNTKFVPMPLPDEIIKNASILVYDYNGKRVGSFNVGTFLSKITWAISDIDGDGNLEIIILDRTSFEDSVNLKKGTYAIYIFDNQGNLLKKILKEYKPFSYVSDVTPSIGNLDDDEELEIIVAVSGRSSSTEESAYTIIHAFNPDGSELWSKIVEASIFSSPAIGDINNDGKNEIIVGINGLKEFKIHGGVYALDNKGNILWKALDEKDIGSSLALADFDNDGFLEIVVSVFEDYETYILNYNGEIVNGWPQPTVWNDYSSPIVGDVNGDGKLDVLTTAGGNYLCPNNCGGVYAWNFDGSLIKGFPKVTEIDAQAAAVIGDIDNDGKVELVASSNHDGDKFRKESKHRGSIYVWDLDGNYDGSLMPWPTFHHDAQRTGNYHFEPRPQSKIVNNENYNLEGFLTIRIKKIVKDIPGAWVVYEEVIDEKMIVPMNGLIKLDKIFNPIGFTPTEIGKYKVVIEFRDEEGYLIETKDGQLKAEWEFEVVDL